MSALALRTKSIMKSKATKLGTQVVSPMPQDDPEANVSAPARSSGRAFGAAGSGYPRNWLETSGREFERV